MKKIIIAACAVLVLASPCLAGFLDNLTQGVFSSKEEALDDNTIGQGLKEALAVGTERSVKEVSRTDGYFGNALIKILLPDTLQKAANLLRSVGFQKPVDDFVLSMNRAAEMAAPKAAAFFGDAIRQMTLEDVRLILTGGDTAATKFFERKTRPQLYTAFKPTVGQTMGKVGTVQAYKDMVGKVETMPMGSLVGARSFDLDDYVTNKALDGLFLMVGEEEKKIRTNPVAQTTDLLRKVFGGK